MRGGQPVLAVSWEHVHTLGVGPGGLPHPSLNTLSVPCFHLQLRSAGAQVIQDLVCDAGALSSLDLSDNGEATREPIHAPIIHLTPGVRTLCPGSKALCITLVTPRLWLGHGDSGACHREEPVSETRGPWKELQRSVQVSPKPILIPLRKDSRTQIGA